MVLILTQELLDASNGDGPGSVLHQHGYDITAGRDHFAIVVERHSSQTARSVCGQIVTQLQIIAGPEPIVAVDVLYQNYSMVLCSMEGSVSEDGVRRWIQTLLMQGVTRGRHLGISQRASSLMDLGQALDQSIEAWQMGEELSRPNKAYYHDELPLYRLLSSLKAKDRLDEFYEETLGPLERYDRVYDTELVRTLEAFFDHNANSIQASKALSVHRNTMSYRLQRIAEITHLDLSSPEARLTLQLALKIHRLAI